MQPQQQTQLRDPLVQTLLSLFIPLYMIYWLYVTAKDIEQRYGLKAPNVWLLFVPLLIIPLLVILPFIGAVVGSTASGSDEGGFTGAGLLFLLAFLVGLPVLFVISFIYYWQFAGNVEKVAGPDTSRVLLLVLFWFVSPAVTFIVQDKLNQLANIPYGAPQQPQYNQGYAQAQPMQSPAAQQWQQNPQNPQGPQTPPQA